MNLIFSFQNCLKKNCFGCSSSFTLLILVSTGLILKIKILADITIVITLNLWVNLGRIESSNKCAWCIISLIEFFFRSSILSAWRGCTHFISFICVIIFLGVILNSTLVDSHAICKQRQAYFFPFNLYAFYFFLLTLLYFLGL